MKRREFLQLSAFAAVAGSAHCILAQGDDSKIKLGKESLSDFERLNKKGMSSVAAIKPEGGSLSEADQQLMMELAAGGMMQLEASRVALKKATAPDVKILAQAEVEEQNGLSAKLKEFAAAKGGTLPAKPDERTRALLAKLEDLSGPAFDRAYVMQSGVQGHQLLDATLKKVRADAKDKALKELAEAAHPLVRAHLEISQDEAKEMA